MSAVCFSQTPNSVTLNSSNGRTNYGQAVTLTATVTSGATGKVTFYDGVIPLGIGTISGGQASMMTVLLQAGTRSLHAYYGGDSTYAASTSAVFPQVVVAGTSLGFQPAVQHTTPVYIASLAVGDFDGDSNPDLVAVGSAGVNVLMGKVDGSFKAAVTYSAGSSPRAVAVGDFNGDGIMDLAVANQNSNNVSILLGVGDGTFQTAVNYTVGSSPESVMVGDFNRDGKMDLAIANYYGSNISVLIGNGDGTFQAAVNYAVASYPQQITAGDFTGLGHTDLAVASYYSSVNVLLGNGDGTFQAATPITVNYDATQVVAADFNDDSKQDLAVGVEYSAGILLGSGDGSFQTPVYYSAGNGSYAMVIGDFNGNGRIDLAVTGYNQTISVLPGNGDGTFQSPASYAVGTSGSTAIVAADFNHDGKADLIVGGNGISVLLGGAVPDLVITETQNNGLTEGQQSATYTITVSNNGPIPTVGTVGVVATLAAALTPISIGGTGWTCTLATLTCTRTDALAAGASYPVITVKFSVSNSYTGNVTGSASVSGGGELNSANDSASNTTYVRLPTTTSLAATPNPASLGHAVTLTATVTAGATGKVTFFTGTTPLGVAALNGAHAVLTTYMLPSGRQSLRATYNGDSSYGPSTSTAVAETVTAVLVNGLQQPANYLADSTPVVVTVGDFDGDGNLDLVTINNGGSYTGSVSVLLGIGDGTFHTALTQVLTQSGYPYPNAVAVGDFNGDGYPDLAVSGNNGVYVLLGKGDGTFQNAVIYGQSGTNYSGVAAADFNGDGKLDLVALSNNSIFVFTGNGDGTFQAPVAAYAGSGGSSFTVFTVADMNGDGKADLVAISAQGNTAVAVLLGNGDGSFQAPVLTVVTNTGSYALAVGDFNGDGKLDAAVPTWNGISVLPGNGDGTFGTVISSTLSYVNNSWVAAGDFNGDGKLDVAASGCCSNQPILALGNGDGTFSSGAYFSGSQNSSRVLVSADFNGDGRPDVAVLSSAVNNAVAVYLGGQFSGLAISPTHAGAFATGQTGTYQIVVTNPVFLTTTGTVTVTDTLPAGLTATAMSGTGWTCTLSTLTCTRTDGLIYGNSYPAITLAVNVSGSLPASTIYNQASVLNGAFLNTATDATVIVIPPAVRIDYPAAGATVSGVITISGWAIDNAVSAASGIGTILVLVDGTAVGNATYGISRPDVCGAYPGRPGCPNVGFTYQLNTGLLAPGQHTISIAATDTDAITETTTASVTVTVVTAIVIPTVFIDAPAPGATVSGAVTVSGWAIDNASAVGTAISGVKVLVDGALVGTATYGVSRGDVCAAYPGRLGCPNVGYTYSLNTAALTLGSHSITVQATDSNATPDTGSTSVTIIVGGPPVAPSVFIDAPASGATVSGTVTVAGWAIDNTTAVGTAISSVKVLIDGTQVGTATYGVNRGDVCAAYPGRSGCPNVGYTYSLNAAALTAGSHTIKVSATDSDGSPDTGSASVTITVAATAARPSVFIDSPTSGSTVSGSGTIIVAGWAIDNTSAVGTAISNVQVLVDGTVVGTANYGVNRADVCAAYPGRAGCPNVGYTYLLNGTTLTAGSHTITVQATDSDSTPDTGSASVTVTLSGGGAAAPTVFIDTPSVTFSGTAITVSGWAIDNTSTVGTAINSVQVFVDGTLVGTADYGAAFSGVAGVSRPDVCAAYPGRPGCPYVGFTYALHTAGLTPGPHGITVIATDSDSTPDTGSAGTTLTFSGGPPALPKVFIDLPAPGATVSGTVTVSGWAVDDWSSISSVQVLVDGTVAGTATYGVSRPDVCVPNIYPGCPNVGYTYALNTAAWTPGSHTIAVTATDSNTLPDTGSATTTVQK